MIKIQEFKNLKMGFSKPPGFVDILTSLKCDWIEHGYFECIILQKLNEVPLAPAEIENFK